MLEIDYCSANINAEVFSNESQCVGAAFVGQTPGGRGVCVAGEEADTMEEKVTLKKSHLGAFHRAPGSPVTTMVVGEPGFTEQSQGSQKVSIGCGQGWPDTALLTGPQ